MKTVFLSAKVGSLCKEYNADPTHSKSYPLAKRFTSTEHSVSIDAEGLREYYELLKQHAAEGYALLKGPLNEPLVNAPRKGKHDKTAPTNLLVIDIDDLTIDNTLIQRPCRPSTVQSMAEFIIQRLPEALRTVSYVACASSSFGIREGKVSMHLHFLLDSPVTPNSQKQWLRKLNYENQEICNQLSLTPSMQGVKSTVDPCMADNSHIVYIAPPQFVGLDNPFENNADRIILVEKQVPVASVSNQINSSSRRLSTSWNKTSAKSCSTPLAEGRSTENHRSP